MPRRAFPPTSLAAIKRYWEAGSRSPLRWLIVLTIGFLLGGIAGASAGIAQILFFVFLAFLVISLVIGLFRRT